ncbi:hypothetical protein AAFF_G00337110 [Aldrovandia affinis]|uniref:Uncharacterized protein n=1 Tax=Aldrovandia affinis TaxID=143900 RepID=A0AAD7WQA8_9TELE|nr:hypothetical protein AAFF_G00337110 [Aldrovandia affinis]
MIEVYLLFFQATIPAFTSFNFLLQREQSSIFLLHDKSYQEPHAIPYKDKANQLPGGKLNIGFTTRAKLNKLLDAGDITSRQVEKFHEAALEFLMKAVQYALQKLPLREPLLKHARFVDVRQRAECGVEYALYFVDRFAHLLPYHGPQGNYLLVTYDSEVTGVSRFQRLSNIAKLVLVLPHSNATQSESFLWWSSRR